MKTPRKDIAEAIAVRTLKVSNTKKLAQEIAAYLLSENREHELESLIRDVLAYRQEHGVVEANVLSAYELSATINHDVEQLLKHHYPHAKSFIVRDTLDADVIGGIKVQLAHEQLDMSVRAKLDQFRRLTVEGTK